MPLFSGSKFKNQFLVHRKWMNPDFQNILIRNVNKIEFVNYRCINFELFETLIEKFEKDICVVKTDEIIYINTIDSDFYEIINSYNFGNSRILYQKNVYIQNENLKLTENVFENLNNSYLGDELIHLLINDVRRFRLESAFNDVDDIEINLAYIFNYDSYVIFDYNMNVLHRIYPESRSSKMPYDELYSSNFLPNFPFL